MNVFITNPFFRRFLASAALCALASTTALAAPMKIEAVITPKADAKLEFADGSKRYLLAAQREGRTAGNGPLSSATVLEWGMHEVNPAVGASANGYLVFTTTDGDVAYLKYQFRAIPIPGPDGKQHFVANGFWEAAGGTGKLKGLRGVGTVQINPAERRWTLEGDLVSSN